MNWVCGGNLTMIDLEDGVSEVEEAIRTDKCRHIHWDWNGEYVCPDCGKRLSEWEDDES